MKKVVHVLSLSLLLFGMSAFAEPMPWPNRPNVIRTAEKLAEEIERFDEALHANPAVPKHIVDKVHHFEETVMEFATEVKVCPYQEALAEMNHIRQDVTTIRTEIEAHPQLLQDPRIYTEWKHVRTAYRYLDHEMGL